MKQSVFRWLIFAVLAWPLTVLVDLVDSEIDLALHGHLTKGSLSAGAALTIFALWALRGWVIFPREKE